MPRTLVVRPITFRAAAAFVAEHHRHNAPPRGHIVSASVVDETGAVRGVVMVGRPVARALDDGVTAEVNRTCTDGCPNANSMLYGVAWRAVRALGYTRMVTYTQASETGASLRAAGARRVAELPARRSWRESSVALKNLRDDVGTGGVPRVRWEWQAEDHRGQLRTRAVAGGVA